MMERIETLGIISKPNKKELREIVPELRRWLEARGIGVRLDEETAAVLGDPAAGEGRAALAAAVDMLLVLGGDGTMLAAARAAGARGLPVLGVNLGNLGFLTEVTIEELFTAIELVLDGRHEVDCRRKLMVEVRRGGEPVQTFHALNDAVLTKTAIARIIDLDAYMDGQFVSNFKADGLIVATPTGSTAYSLSAGGPIVLPAVDAMLLTPVASHMLTNRPLVVPGAGTLEIAVRSDPEAVILTVDGQVGVNLRREDRVLCRLSPHLLKLVRPPGRSYFDVLRNKLKWGTR